MNVTNEKTKSSFIRKFFLINSILFILSFAYTAKADTVSTQSLLDQNCITSSFTGTTDYDWQCSTLVNTGFSFLPSPDGSSILIQSGSNQLLQNVYIYNSDGTTITTEVVGGANSYLLVGDSIFDPTVDVNFFLVLDITTPLDGEFSSQPIAVYQRGGKLYLSDPSFLPSGATSTPVQVLDGTTDFGLAVIIVFLSIGMVAMFANNVFKLKRPWQ